MRVENGRTAAAVDANRRHAAARSVAPPRRGALRHRARSNSVRHRRRAIQAANAEVPAPAAEAQLGRVWLFERE